MFAHHYLLSGFVRAPPSQRRVNSTNRSLVDARLVAANRRIRPVSLLAAPAFPRYCAPIGYRVRRIGQSIQASRPSAAVLTKVPSPGAAETRNLQPRKLRVGRRPPQVLQEHPYRTRVPSAACGPLTPHSGGRAISFSSDPASDSTSYGWPLPGSHTDSKVAGNPSRSHRESIKDSLLYFSSRPGAAWVRRRQPIWRMCMIVDGRVLESNKKDMKKL
jgi:hypothetical protein